MADDYNLAAQEAEIRRQNLISQLLSGDALKNMRERGVAAKARRDSTPDYSSIDDFLSGARDSSLRRGGPTVESPPSTSRGGSDALPGGYTTANPPALPDVPVTAAGYTTANFRPTGGMSGAENYSTEARRPSPTVSPSRPMLPQTTQMMFGPQQPTPPAGPQRATMPATALTPQQRGAAMEESVGRVMEGPREELGVGTGYEALLSRLGSRGQRLEAELAKADVPPNYSQVQNFMKQRRSEYLPSALAAVAIGMGPEAAKGLAAGATERVNAMRDPLKVEGGFVTPEGEVIIDPSFQRQKKMDAIARRIEANEKLIASTTDKQERNRLEQGNQDLKALMIQFARGGGRGGGEGGSGGGGVGPAGHGKLEHTQFVHIPTGETLTHDKTTGNFFRQIPGQQPGTFTQMPVPSSEVGYRGDVPAGGRGGDTLPQNVDARTREHYNNYTNLMRTGPQVLEMIKNNPNAFGWKPGISEAVGAAAGAGPNDVPGFRSNMSAAEMQARAAVYKDAAHLINQLIGTAQSDSERRMLLSFIPLPRESQMSVYNKVNAAITLAQQSRDAMRQQYNLSPMPGPRGPGAGGRGGNQDNSYIPGAR